MNVPEPDGGWQLRIGDFIKAHPGHVIRGAANGYGWTAQARDEHGRPRGEVLTGPEAGRAGREDQGSGLVRNCPAGAPRSCHGRFKIMKSAREW